MFSLNTETVPATSAELTKALRESLARTFTLTTEPVTVRGAEYPALDQLNIVLDGAQLRSDAPRPALASGPLTPALQVKQFTASGRDLSVAGLRANLSIEASGLCLSAGKEKGGTIVLAIQTAVSGRVDVSTTKSALEKMITELVQTEAAKHGVSIDAVRLKLETQGPRALSAEVQLRARKLFLSAAIRIRAHLALDENLNAKLSGLRCEGDGAIASVACGVLAPHLQKMEGRELALMALPLGEIQLRDVGISVGEEVAITAEFGRAA